MTSRFPWLAVLLGLTTGCLGSTHVIPQDELQRLAASAPEQRGQRVRVVQEFATATEPPRAPAVHVHTAVIVTSGARRHGRPNPSSADVDADSAAVTLFLAGAAALGLAATEGARYDGWVQLHPMHPVHLRMADGSYIWVPLAHLDPGLAAASREAIVHDAEGPWTPIGRAPLNRVGFTYALELGGAGLDTMTADAPWGFMGRIQFGGFPIQQLGFLVSVGLGWGENDDQETIFNSRYAFELHAYPLSAGVLSVGTYGQVGYRYGDEDLIGGGTRHTAGPMYGGGLLAQLELTTRLALTMRAGVAALVETETVAAPEGSIGLAIY